MDTRSIWKVLITQSSKKFAMTPPTENPTRAKSVQLDWQDDEGQVTVTPANEDRFMLQMRTAIEVLQQSKQVEEFQLRLKVLMNALAVWLKSQEDVEKAYVTIRDGSLAFVVVRSTSRYSEEFEDAITDLEFEIANDPDFSGIDVEVIGLPSISKSALDSFLHDNFSIEYATSN